MPVLVLGGEFDSWTPPVDVPRILGQLGGHQRFVKLANATHVVGEGDQPCGSALVQAFVRSPAAIDTMDAVLCRRRATHPDRRVLPGVGRPGDRRDAGPRQSSAHQTASGWWLPPWPPQGTPWRAPRGSVPSATPASTVAPSAPPEVVSHLTLAGDQLVPGVAVSGTVRVGETVVTALLGVVGPSGRSVDLTASWPVTGAAAVAQVTATAGGRAFTATCPAP